MTQSNFPITISVDREHGGLRLAIAVIFIFLVIVSFIVLNLLIPANTLNLLALIGALVIGGVITNIFEQQLKQRWPSGKTLILSESEIALQKIAHTRFTAANTEKATTHRWAFQIQKRTRVPKGWYMVAVAIEKDDDTLAIYTLLPPEAYHTLNEDESFIVLSKSADIPTDDMRLAGKQKRLQEMEAIRWQMGVEASPEDFETVLQHIERLWSL